jgi:mRNA interferase YafQ
MIYSIRATKLFKKQYEKVLKQGRSRYKIEKVISDLACLVKMPDEYRVHKLKGELKGMYELHIEPDLLLIYEYRHDILILKLIKIGSHSELFK